MCFGKYVRCYLNGEFVSSGDQLTAAIFSCGELRPSIAVVLRRQTGALGPREWWPPGGPAHPAGGEDANPGLPRGSLGSFPRGRHPTWWAATPARGNVTVVSHAWARGRATRFPRVGGARQGGTSSGRAVGTRGPIGRAGRRRGARTPTVRVREGRAPAGGGRAKRRPGGIENGIAEPGSAGRGPGPGRGRWRRRYSPPPSTPTTSPPNCGGW